MTFYDHLRICLPIGWLVCLGCLSLPVSGQDRAFGFDEGLTQIWKHYQEKNFEEVNRRISEFTSQFASDPTFLEVAKRIHYLDAMAATQLENWGRVAEAGERYAQASGSPEEGWDEEIAFWRALALSKTGQFEESLNLLKAFVGKFPESEKRQTAQFLIAGCHLNLGNFTAADLHLETLRQTLKGPQWGKALLLQLSALVQANQPARAAGVILEGQERLDEVSQVAALQLLALKISRQLAASGEQRQSISLLLRMLDHESIRKAQAAKLDSLQQEKTSLEAALENETADSTGEPARWKLRETTKLIAQIEQDSQRMEKIPHFDATVDFQLASAYLSLGRYRETAFLIEQMLETLPANPISEAAIDTLIKCHAAVNRWSKVTETANQFAEKYPSSEALPGVHLLKGQALMEQDAFNQAMPEFARIAERYPNHELAAHALFLLGYCLSRQEEFSEAQAIFRQILERYPEHERADPAAYWIGNTQSMDRDYPASIESMESYLTRHPDGRHATDARYRIAFAYHAMGELEKSVPLLESFVADHPETPDAAEALLLLGEAEFAKGNIDEGIAILKKVPVGIQSYAEEAWFKIGKAYRLNRENENMREHFIAFQEKFPDSARIAEAVYWVGRSYEEDAEATRRVYREAFDRHGGHVRQWGITEILAAYQKLLDTDTARAEYREEMKSTAARAERLGKYTLAARCHYALGLLDRKESVEKALPHMKRALELADFSRENPALLVNIAEVLRQTGATGEAEKAFRDIRRWNPSTPVRDRIYLALGEITLERGDPDEAMKWFERFLRETPASPLRHEVVMHVAGIEADRQDYPRAVALFESVLEEPGAARSLKVEAMLALGRVHMAAGDPKAAFPYFQRIYVMYAGYPAAAVESYLQSGIALEKLQDTPAAARTYMELLDRTEFFGPEHSKLYSQARDRLNALPATAREEAQRRIDAAAEALKLREEAS